MRRRGSRRSPPRTTCSATPRSAPPTTACARWVRPDSVRGSERPGLPVEPAARVARWGAVRAGERRRHGRPVRRALRRSGEARRAPARIPAGRGSRDHGHRLVRRRDDGNDRPDQDRRSGRVLALPRIGSRAGDPADHLSAVSGQRRDRGEPRVLLDVAAVPAVRGSRADRGVPVHEVSRDRCGAPDPHPAREDPGGGAQRRQDPSRRQGRAGSCRRSLRATST